MPERPRAGRSRWGLGSTLFEFVRLVKWRPALTGISRYVIKIEVQRYWSVAAGTIISIAPVIFKLY